MGPLDETSLTDEGSWDSGDEDDEVPTADHNMSRSRQDYDMGAMNDTDAGNQALEDLMSSDEEFEDRRSSNGWSQQQAQKVDYSISPNMDIIYESDAPLDERFSEMINYPIGRIRQPVDYSIRPMRDIF
ncbi:hypothetical protein IFR05_004066 [Cadophora sp. M221]|nr:hypothetical protein IFR05_004066 [Cadophora sp. M221]